MGEKQMQALANKLTKNLKPPEDLNSFDRLLKNQPKSAANTRSGYAAKHVSNSDDTLELRTPRDRDGFFEPRRVKKSPMIFIRRSTVHRATLKSSRSH